MFYNIIILAKDIPTLTPWFLICVNRWLFKIVLIIKNNIENCLSRVDCPFTETSKFSQLDWKVDYIAVAKSFEQKNFAIFFLEFLWNIFKNFFLRNYIRLKLFLFWMIIRERKCSYDGCTNEGIINFFSKKHFFHLKNEKMFLLFCNLNDWKWITMKDESDD